MDYKIENFIYDLEANLKANLTSYIDAINTANGDSLLEAFADESYFIQTLDERVANYNQFIILQAGNPALNSGLGGAVALTYPLAVYLSFDAGNSDVGAKRLFRYLDALMECVMENFWKVSSKKFLISGVDQMALIDIDKSKRVVATGITLEVSFG